MGLQLGALGDTREGTHHAVDQDAERNPEEQREGHHGAHQIVSQELAQGADVQLLYEVPETLHHVLHLLHALPLDRWMSSMSSMSMRINTRWITPGVDTHCSVTEAHGARLALPQEQKEPILVLVGLTGTPAGEAADLTRRGRVCREAESVCVCAGRDIFTRETESVCVCLPLQAQGCSCSVA